MQLHVWSSIKIIFQLTHGTRGQNVVLHHFYYVERNAKSAKFINIQNTSAHNYKRPAENFLFDEIQNPFRIEYNYNLLVSLYHSTAILLNDSFTNLLNCYITISLTRCLPREFRACRYSKIYSFAPKTNSI